jgi:hypothetical protein
MTRSEFEASIRATATYSADEGTQGYLLTEKQFAAILAAADQYAAHLIEQTARPRWRAERSVS